MLFTSTIFIFLFLPFVLFGYYIWLKGNRNLQNIFLLIMSLIFYAWGEPWFVFVMIISILANWFFGILIDKYREDRIESKIIITVMLVFNLAIIFIFKYLMFTVDNINLLFKTNIKVPNIVLPIGISFFTFQAISYVIDVYRGNGQVQKNLLNVGLYISFFPQLIAGPIVRYKTIAEEIENREETFDDFSKGVCRFIVGFNKKVLLANNLAIVADKAFSVDSGKISITFAWLGAIAYTFQIFFDFSGYSDMAIGLGKMFGFHFDENFDYPYASESVSEIWRRWHISLGTWFRDYVYFPLGGSKVDSKARLLFNLFVVWLLTGIWHGANWTFIAWGVFYFLLISIEKLINFEKMVFTPNWLKNIYTLIAVILGWVLFKASDIMAAVAYFKSMFGLNGNKLIDDYTLLCLLENKYFLIFSIIFSMPIAKWISDRFKDKFVVLIYQMSCVFLFIISISYIVKGSYNPFIYFNF